MLPAEASAALYLRFWFLGRLFWGYMHELAMRHLSRTLGCSIVPNFIEITQFEAVIWRFSRWPPSAISNFVETRKCTVTIWCRQRTHFQSTYRILCWSAVEMCVKNGGHTHAHSTSGSGFDMRHLSGTADTMQNCSVPPNLSQIRQSAYAAELSLLLTIFTWPSTLHRPLWISTEA